MRFIGRRLQHRQQVWTRSPGPVPSASLHAFHTILRILSFFFHLDVNIFIKSTFHKNPDSWLIF